jgi:hypothetical protein
MDDSPQEYLDWLRDTDCHPPETSNRCPALDKTGYNCHGWDPHAGRRAPWGRMDEETFIFFMANDLFGPCQCSPDNKCKCKCKCGVVVVVIDNYNNVEEARAVW